MAFSISRTPGTQRTMYNIVRASATAAETGLVNISNLASQGNVNFGFYVQAVTSSVVVSITMEDPEFAMNPSNNGKVPWKVFASLAAGDYLTLAFPVTVLKLAFSAPGSAYIGYL